jgi:hypothetical protein
MLSTTSTIINFGRNADEVNGVEGNSPSSESLMRKTVRICEPVGEGSSQPLLQALCRGGVRKTMAQVAVIGRAKPRTTQQRVRISTVLSDHAVANSWWSPSSLPEWLNEDW